jgi:hypothetical protein
MSEQLPSAQKYRLVAVFGLWIPVCIEYKLCMGFVLCGSNNIRRVEVFGMLLMRGGERLTQIGIMAEP